MRTLKTGETVGGIPFTRGPLAHLLRNRFYIGEVVFKGEILAGEQPAIVDRDLFEAVQAKLTEQVTNHKVSRTKSEALLSGRIFDDRGHRMTPSHARKRGIKYRYYISSALLQGRPEQAGTVSRIPAHEIETLVVKAVRDHLNESAEIADAVLIHNHVARVEVQSDQLVIELTDANAVGSKRKRNSRNVIEVPWRKTPSTRRREILVPESGAPQDIRPIRSENRALLVASIAQGRRWLDELMTDPTANTESIAEREGCSVRKVNMTISLAFLAPDLVKAAIEGRLPHGWESRGCAICPPNGLANARCSGFNTQSSSFEPRLCLTTVSVAGNGISRPETDSPEIALRAEISLRRDHSTDGRARQLGAFWQLREISSSRECVVASGGLELRARHAVISNASLRFGSRS